MTKSKIFLILFLILAISVAILMLISQPKDTPTAAQNIKALIGGPFSLIDHHGKNVTDQDFKGKYMLIYFGYTFCPDVCPTELQIMSDALDRLPETTLNEIFPIFITVDPDRDTIDVMTQYVQAFHPKMIGLTGSEEQVKTVKAAYRVYAAKEISKDNTIDKDAYLVSHTSYIYLIDRNGEYVTHFRSQTDPKVMAERLLAEIK